MSGLSDTGAHRVFSPPRPVPTGENQTPAVDSRTVIGEVAPAPANNRTVIGEVAPKPAPVSDNRTVIGAVAPANADNRTVIGAVSPVAANAGKAKILIVMDSKAIMMLLSHQLTQAGYQVIPLLNSIEAPISITKERPDLVLMGVEMAQLSGPDICKMIRTRDSMAEFANLPVLLYSSTSEAELQQKVQECQASGYIHKTWSKDMVASKIAQFLNKN